ncbi:MAG: hypothetical protein WC755_09535 [Candidatus Woesearchaeota archaeon]|jgi:hypothetical protein
MKKVILKYYIAVTLDARSVRSIKEGIKYFDNKYDDTFDDIFQQGKSSEYVEGKAKIVYNYKIKKSRKQIVL